MSGEMEKCEKCGKEVRIGEWPFCPHDPYSGGMLGHFLSYYDENVAPPPNSSSFKPAPGVSLPDYHPDKGYHITSLADRHKLMRMTGAKEKEPRRHLGEIRRERHERGSR